MTRLGQIIEDIEHDESMHPSDCERECCADRDASFWWDEPAAEAEPVREREVA